MSNITVNTKIVKNSIAELETYEKYYSNKKNVFLRSGYGNSPKLSNYLAKIQSIYTDIGTNIKALNTYLKDYTADLEGIEHGMSSKGWQVKEDNVHDLVSKYKDSIKIKKLEANTLFEVTYLNGANKRPNYENTDPLKGGLATVGTCLLAFGEGLLNVGEMLLDAGATIVAASYSLDAALYGDKYGDATKAKEIGNFIKKDLSKDFYQELVTKTGLANYADPNSTGANIASGIGSIGGMVAASVLTGGLAASAFGAGTAAASTATAAGGAILTGLTSMGSSSESALKTGATIGEAAAVSSIAGLTGAVTGWLTGKLDAAARGIGANTDEIGAGLCKIVEKSIASFGVSISEPIINEVASTVIYDHDQDRGLFENFVTNAQEDCLLVQVLLAGGVNALGTLFNGLGGISERQKSVLAKDLGATIDDTFNLVDTIGGTSEMAPIIITKEELDLKLLEYNNILDNNPLLKQVIEDEEKGFSVRIQNSIYDDYIKIKSLQADIIAGKDAIGIKDPPLINSFARFNRNAISLKNELLKKVENIDDPIAKARALYMELNKKMHYDLSYIKGGPQLKNLIYDTPVSFEALSENNSVICKGWSELYEELLLASGFSKENVHIVGSPTFGSHKWIEISIGEKIIIADATENINGTIDLVASKGGLATNGFMYLDPSWSGTRIRNSYKNKLFSEEDLKFNESWLYNLDKELGYASESGYLADQIKISQELFASPELTSQIFDDNLASSINKVLSMDIPNEMDGFEAYGYYKKIFDIILKDQANTVKYNTLYQKVGDTIEPLLSISYPENGELRQYIYSKNLGKKIFTNAKEYNDFLDSLNLVN